MFNKNKKRNPKIFSRPNRSTSRVSSGGSVARRHRPDYGILLIALGLLGIGLIVVYSISPGLASTRGVSESYFVIKQLLAIALGLITFFIFSVIPTNVLKKSSSIFAIIAGLVALGVQIFGSSVNGASRWIQLGSLSFQVAELIKLSLIIWLAAFLVEKVNQKASSKEILKPILVIIGLIGVVVAKFESDLGSAGVMLSIVIVMAYVAGLSLRFVATIALITCVGVLLAISTSSYRRQRVETFLNPSSDCQDSGYQACQAMIAVGSGGLFGLGFSRSVQAYGYLPEAANDSIFAVIAEKFGFVGVSIVISVYLWLFSRFKKIIDTTQDLYSRSLVVGILIWLSSQTIINMGAMIGLLPLKGITLPFISYGGTSLVFVMAALGIVFQVSRYTSFAPIRNVNNIGDANRDSISGRRGQRRTHYASTSYR